MEVLLEIIQVVIVGIPFTRHRLEIILQVINYLASWRDLVMIDNLSQDDFQ